MNSPSTAPPLFFYLRWPSYPNTNTNCKENPRMAHTQKEKCKQTANSRPGASSRGSIVAARARRCEPHRLHYRAIRMRRRAKEGRKKEREEQKCQGALREARHTQTNTKSNCNGKFQEVDRRRGEEEGRKASPVVFFFLCAAQSGVCGG